MRGKSRLRGLRALVGDVIESGSTAVEEVHKATAARAFTVLEAIPAVSKPAGIVHAVHDAWLSGVYRAIRGVNGVVGQALDAAIDAAEETSGNGEHHRE